MALVDGEGNGGKKIPVLVGKPPSKSGDKIMEEGEVAEQPIDKLLQDVKLSFP